MPTGSLTLTAPTDIHASLRGMQDRLAAVVVFMSSEAFLHLVVAFISAMLPKLHELSPIVLGLLCGLVVVLACIALFVSMSLEAIRRMLQLHAPLLLYRLLIASIATVYQTFKALFRPPRTTTVVAL